MKMYVYFVLFLLVFKQDLKTASTVDTLLTRPVIHWLKLHLYFSSWLKGPNIIYTNPRLYSTLTENVKSVILHYGRNRIIKIRSFNYKWHLPLWSRLLLYPAGVRGRMKMKPPLEQLWHRSHGEVLPVSLGNISVCLFLSNCNYCNIL